MIMRIYHPDAGTGTIRVLGHADFAAANDHIRYLPEERGLYKKMKVRDILRFYAELKGCRDFNERVRTWLARFDLSSWADKRVEALSKGMAQKVQFISAIIAEPELVILDEPFTGLDPVNADVLREGGAGPATPRATVIFSTHDMGMAEKMCDFIFYDLQGAEGVGRHAGIYPGPLRPGHHPRASCRQWVCSAETTRRREGHGLRPAAGVADASGGRQPGGARSDHAAGAYSISNLPSRRCTTFCAYRGRRAEAEATRRPAKFLRRWSMRKALVVAVREYQAAVKTKAFIISLLALPLIWGGSMAVQLFMRQGGHEGQAHCDPRLHRKAG